MGVVYKFKKEVIDFVLQQKGRITTGAAGNSPSLPVKNLKYKFQIFH